MTGDGIRELFPGLKDTIYLNTATMNVGCAPARAAYERAVDSSFAASSSTASVPSSPAARLSQRLLDGPVAHGSAVRPFPLPHRSTIVSVPVDDTEAAMARLRSANVVASVRTGRVRLSVHFYNLEEELDRVAELLASA